MNEVLSKNWGSLLLICLEYAPIKSYNLRAWFSSYMAYEASENSTQIASVHRLTLVLLSVSGTLSIFVSDPPTSGSSDQTKKQVCL